MIMGIIDTGILDCDPWAIGNRYTAKSTHEWPFEVTDDGLAFIMDDIDKVHFLDQIYSDLNKMPQCGDINVMESLLGLRRKIDEIIVGVEAWQQQRTDLRAFEEQSK
jgi:hypothetical protein